MCVSDDVRSESAPGVVRAVQEGLDNPLCKAMKEGKDEEAYGDPVQSYPQVLSWTGLSARAEKSWWVHSR